MAHAQCIPFHLIDDALVLLTLSSQKQKTSGAAGRLASGLVHEPQFQEAILLLRAQGYSPSHHSVVPNAGVSPIFRSLLIAYFPSLL